MFGLPEWLDVMVRAVTFMTLGLIYAVVLVNLMGLRTFSKMTSFDFIATVAAGSLLAQFGVASSWSRLWQTTCALATLLVAQLIFAHLRKRSDYAAQRMSNEPLLLALNGEFLANAMDESAVRREDIVAKLREANVLNLNEVRAVVLETTGDVSVLHGPPSEKALDGALLDGVRVGDVRLEDVRSEDVSRSPDS